MNPESLRSELRTILANLDRAVEVRDWEGVKHAAKRIGLAAMEIGANK